MLYLRYAILVVALAQFQRCVTASRLRRSTSLHHQHLLLLNCILCCGFCAVAYLSEKWR